MPGSPLRPVPQPAPSGRPGIPLVAKVMLGGCAACLLTVGGCVILGMFAVHGASKQEQEAIAAVQAGKTEFKIDSVSLAEEYDHGKDAADAKYKEKVGQVEGTVTNVAKDLSDKMKVDLDGATLTAVAIYFDDANECTKYKKGQYLVVIGRCEGMVWNVWFSHCKVTSSGPIEKSAKAEVAAGIEKIVKDYSDNQVSAEQKYRNKVVTAEGKVAEVSEDAFDKAQKYVSVEVSGGSLACYLDSADEATLSTIKKGQHIKVVGRCAGPSIGSLKLGQCRVVDLKEGSEGEDKKPDKQPEKPEGDGDEKDGDK